MPAMTSNSIETMGCIKKYIAGNISIDEALRRTTSPIEAQYVAADHANTGSNSAESLLWDLWHQTIDIAKSISYPQESEQRQRLVNFLSALKTRPTPELTPAALEKVKDDLPWSEAQGNLWGKLTIWGWAVRESYDVLDPGNGVSGPEEGSATVEEWVNLNAFLADLTHNGVSDQSFLALSVIRQALEMGPGRRQSVAAAANGRNANLAAASVWIIIMGKKWAQNGWDDPSMKGRTPPSNSLWQGEMFKIDSQRVALWARRLKELLHNDSQGQRAMSWQPLGEAALKSIEDIE